MNNYMETKNKLDKIRDKYGCKGEILFRSAIQCVIECGQQTFQDPIWVQQQLKNIDINHNEAERDNKILFVSRDFEKAITECASEIAQVSVYDLLVYIQREVWLSNEGIDYKRAIKLLKSCVDWFTDDTTNERIVENLELLGFKDDEIEELGYGWLFDEEE